MKPLLACGPLVGCVLWLGVLGLPALGAAETTVDPQHPLAPALEHAYNSRQTMNEVQDYEAIFSKRELVGRRMAATTVRLKVREQPFSVYMQFENPHKGREVLYVDGRNNGKILAHETGLKAIAGTVSLDPSSDTAMEDNRYPITMVGLRNLLDKIIRQWEAEAQFGEVDVKFYPDARLGDTACKVIESTHPQPRKQFRFHMTRLYIDKATNYPVRVEQWAFPVNGGKPQLIEEYTYTKVQTNLGLRDGDFDVSNPNYAFPR